MFSWSYAEDGHYFVGFTSELFTLVYDMSTNAWHERESLVTGKLQNTETLRCRYNELLQAYGRVLAADSIDGRIGELSSKVYKEYSEALRMSFTTATVFYSGAPFSIPWVEAFCQPGVGNRDKQEPVVNISVSRDGYVFGDYQKVNIGRVGQYKKRQVIRHWGRFPRFAIFEAVIGDAVERRVMGMSVNREQGSGNGR